MVSANPGKPLVAVMHSARIQLYSIHREEVKGVWNAASSVYLYVLTVPAVWNVWFFVRSCVQQHADSYRGLALDGTRSAINVELSCCSGVQYWHGHLLACGSVLEIILHGHASKVN